MWQLIEEISRMTREQVHKEYTVINGRIVSNGKFENEKVYVPYLYSLFMDGLSDPIDDNGDTLEKIELTQEDKSLYSELTPYDYALLFIDSNGFIYCTLYK